MSMDENRKEVIKFFIDGGFKQRTEYKTFTQLDKNIKNDIDKYNKTFSVVLSEKTFYIMLHSQGTGDYLFSEHFKLDLPTKELRKTLEKIYDCYLIFNDLF